MTTYRADVVALTSSGPVVTIPRLAANLPPNIGPLPTLVDALDIGDQVLVEDGLDGRVDQFIVLGRVVPVVTVVDPPIEILAGYAGGYAGGY